MSSRFLIWDFDGTLAQRPGGWSGALAEVARQSVPDLKLTADQLRPYLQSGFPWHAPECQHSDQSADDWWMDMQVVFNRAFRSAGVEAGQARKLAAQVRGVYTNTSSWKLFDDSVPALQTLKEHGWRHILLSNHVPELPNLLDYLTLTGHFEKIFNSAQTGWEKPNGHAFRLAQDWMAEQVGEGQAVECWVIGDNLSDDVRGAEEAGLRAILVRKKEAGVTCCESLEALVKKLK